MRPATKAQALAAWRGESLRRILNVRLELSAVESLVRSGITGPRLDEAVERAWDAAGRIASVTTGPDLSEEQLAAEAAR